MGVKSHIRCSDTILSKNNEILKTTLHAKNNSVDLIACYLPHSNDVELVESFFEELYKLIQNSKNYILLGDFNLPEADWLKGSFPEKPQYEIFEKFITKCEPITQHVLSPTRDDNILDLVFTSSSSSLTNLKYLPPIDKSDHVTITFEFSFQKSKTVKKIKDFKKCDYIKFSKYLKNIRWTNLNDNSACESWNIFQNIITDGISKFVPLKKISTPYAKKDNFSVTTKRHINVLKGPGKERVFFDQKNLI